MPRRDIVAGQPVSPEKATAARRLRRAATPAEQVLWGCLRGRRLAGVKFRRQQVIAGFVADFYCPDAGLVVELDGPVHDGQTAADAERERVLTSRGLRVMRVANERVSADLAGVLGAIVGALKATSPPGLLSETERGRY